MKRRLKRAFCRVTTRHRQQLVESYEPARQVETSDGAWWLLDTFWSCRCGLRRHGEGSKLPF